jgi:GMP synthase-like glutamine amidotransferase
MILVLDNKSNKEDNLAYNSQIKKALKSLNIPYIIVDKIKLIDLSKIKGVIISGSSLKLSKISKKGSFIDYDFNFYYLSKLDVPIIGMCFGCQLLNILYGGTLEDNKKYICEDISFLKYDKEYPLFKDLTTINFGYCFSDIVIPPKNMGVKKFASIKYNNKLYNVAFEFEKNKVFGTLFHPEIKTDTYIIFKNFYDICKKYNKKH